MKEGDWEQEMEREKSIKIDISVKCDATKVYEVSCRMNRVPSSLPRIFHGDLIKSFYKSQK